MATYTPNYHLSKPESTDPMTSFMEDYAANMDAIDSNLGGGGGGGDSVTWTQIQQSGIKIAEIEINGAITDVYAPQGAPPFTALIIITADTGSTITATKGADTYTATEVTTGQYEVTVDSIGTWTISDGTLSDTVTVTAQTTYYVTLSAVPDGRTVLPTDDIQIWLNCADIWDKTYTTLAEVLADTTTLLALINSNNAVDYMVRSTSFIYGVGTVPAMTSATTPGGIVGGSISSTGHEAYKAFDGDNTTYALRSASSSGGVDYTSSEAKSVKAMYVFNASSTALNFTIYYKETAESANATASSTVSIPSNSGKYINTTLDNYSGILWGAFAQTISGTTDLKISTVQFYDFGVVLSSTAMSYIGLNNYCANTLLADSTWCEAICNSEYFESVLNVKIPVMTSNTTPSGKAFGDSIDTSYPAYKAMDGSDTSYALSLGNATNPTFGYTFPTNHSIYLARLLVSSSANSTVTYTCKIQGSNDEFTNDVHDITEAFTYSASINDKIPVKKICTLLSGSSSYRVINTARTSSAARFMAYTIQFYGREDI